VISDRDVFVIGIERVIGIAPHPAVARVVDAGEEIGKAADDGRQVQRAIRCIMEQPCLERLYFRPLRVVSSQQR
jgi:hypothetical protein